MEVSDQIDAPTALPTRKQPSVGWASEPVWTLWGREKNLTLPEIGPWTFNH
jgi:hypothetical protein